MDACHQSQTLVMETRHSAAKAVDRKQDGFQGDVTRGQGAETVVAMVACG